jgi:hypothetical protein
MYLDGWRVKGSRRSPELSLRSKLKYRERRVEVQVQDEASADISSRVVGFGSSSSQTSVGRDDGNATRLSV